MPSLGTLGLVFFKTWKLLKCWHCLGPTGHCCSCSWVHEYWAEQDDGSVGELFRNLSAELQECQGETKQKKEKEPEEDLQWRGKGRRWETVQVGIGGKHPKEKLPSRRGRTSPLSGEEAVHPEPGTYYQRHQERLHSQKPVQGLTLGSGSKRGRGLHHHILPKMLPLAGCLWKEERCIWFLN